MNSSPMKESCIEVTGTGRRDPMTVSVREYVATAERARRFSPAKCPFDIDWATFGLPVEKLTREYQQPGFGLPRFRICDWDRYNAQMRQLLGLV